MVEIHNILKSNGLLVIAQYCYSPDTSIIAKDSEKLVLNINPKWLLHSFNGLYPSHIDLISKQYQYNIENKRNKFEFCELFCYDHDEPFTVESWVGRMLTCNGVGSGTLDDIIVDKYKNDLTKILKGNIDTSHDFIKQFEGKYCFKDDSVFTVKHRVWCTISKKIDNYINSKL